MANIVIFEDSGYRDLLPLVYWRAVTELRTGYHSLWEHALRTFDVAASTVGLYCRPWFAEVAAERLGCPVNQAPTGGPTLFVNARLLLAESLDVGPCPAVQYAGQVPMFIHADAALAAKLTPECMLNSAALAKALHGVPEHRFTDHPRVICHPWDLVQANMARLLVDWERAGQPASIRGRLCPGVHLLNESAVHVGEGTVIKPCAVLDAEHGPIYIGKDVTISANVSIEGPCYIGDGSLVQPGSVLRDAMSVGRRCKVGGELESSIIHGFSNKQHDGFLGHAYVAEWVNLAADTINSDLKNTYGSIRVPINGVEVETGLMFVGLTIGDHSKTGIGQLFPTGAVVGFGSHIATCEFAPKFVPSFTWITGENPVSYDPDRCLELARRVMLRRQVTMTAAEAVLFKRLPEEVKRVEAH